MSGAMGAEDSADPFYRIGQWELLIHDHGWLIAHRRVVQLEGKWPTYGTFWRKRNA